MYVTNYSHKQSRLYKQQQKAPNVGAVRRSQYIAMQLIAMQLITLHHFYTAYKSKFQETLS